MNDTQRTVEIVLRTSYGRLIAYLSCRSGDVAGAEDALSDAFYKALERWPEIGVPPQPEAWLLRTARNHLIDEARKQKVRQNALPVLFRDLVIRAVEETENALRQDILPDDRLKLLFVCSHPALDPAIRTPLMLQTILGFDAARIASAFLVTTTTMSQRLVRAKNKIREAKISFETPNRDELPTRLEAVLEAIYVLYGQGWEDLALSDTRWESLVSEAFYLARLVVQLLPVEPEPRGLLALMLFCEARRLARRTPQGVFVPLSMQNPLLWSRPMIEEAEHHLSEAAKWQKIGRFQLEAAIQSVHIASGITGQSNKEAIVYLYEGLLKISPTVGAVIGKAAALGEWQGPEAGLALLQTLNTDSISSYQSFWAVKAHLLEQAGQKANAIHAFDLAIGLTKDPAIRQFLLLCRSQTNK